MTRQWSKFQSWNGNEKQWVENSEYVEEDLSYLLGLKVTDFWEIVKDPHCTALLDSCLIGLPRSQSEVDSYASGLKINLERIYRRIFLVFLRLSTHKEKPFSSPEEFGKVIYNNFLISLPQIFDLCNLFYGGSAPRLRDMLENIFKHQPNYMRNDLCMAIDLMATQLMRRDNKNDEEDALDTFRTIHNFLSIYPKAGKLFYAKGFHVRAAEFYGQQLSKKSNRNGKLARDMLLRSVRLIIQTQFLTPCSAESFQEYQDLLLHLIPEDNFIVDYDAKFPVSEDISVFTSQNPDVDLKGVEYILEGVSRGRESLTERIISKSAQMDTGGSSSAVQLVKETLPELGEGFILSCLEHFEGDPARVINALFEDKLPSHLCEMDRSSAMTKPKPAPKSKSKAILEDRSFMKDENMKSFYEVRGLVSDVVVNMAGDAEYEDEYDDTYDDQAVGLEEPDPYSDRRAFVLPRALGGGHVGRTQQMGPDSEEDEDKKPTLSFCRNPEEVREERERKRQAQTGHRGASGFGNVVGNKKGQGQEKSVLISRARKNASKNKGQRVGADRKMAKGMF